MERPSRPDPHDERPLRLPLVPSSRRPLSGGCAVKFRAEYFVIGFHHDFVGIADANRDGRSVTNDAELVVEELLLLLREDRRGAPPGQQVAFTSGSASRQPLPAITVLRLSGRSPSISPSSASARP